MTAILNRPALGSTEAALEWAVRAAILSGCEKSKRGAVIWIPGADGPVAKGSNHQPDPHQCDGSPACRSSCAKLCVHAEAAAILDLGSFLGHGLHMLHVKVVDGRPVPSGPPSCWQCSRLILASRALSMQPSMTAVAPSAPSRAMSPSTWLAASPAAISVAASSTSMLHKR